MPLVLSGGILLLQNHCNRPFKLLLQSRPRDVTLYHLQSPDCIIQPGSRILFIPHSICRRCHLSHVFANSSRRWEGSVEFDLKIQPLPFPIHYSSVWKWLDFFFLIAPRTILQNLIYRPHHGWVGSLCNLVLSFWLLSNPLHLLKQRMVSEHGQRMEFCEENSKCLWENKTRVLWPQFLQNT